MQIQKNKDSAWVLAVDMGYGHRRAAYPLKDLAEGGVLVANEYKGLPANEKRLWDQTRGGYEAVSRSRAIPVVGQLIFKIFDFIQRIAPFYPRRDLSRANFQLKQTYATIEKMGLGKDLILRLKQKNGRLPLISTFYPGAFSAEIYKYPGEIYCVICDADIARTWAPRNPRNSRINYLAPNKRVIQRLQLYGVSHKKIFYTGFPLPKENTGSPKLEVLKRDLGHRLFNLDPNRVFLKRYEKLLVQYLGKGNLPRKSDHPLTLAFAIGGAGAQRDIAVEVVRSLKHHIQQGQIGVNLIAGTRSEVQRHFEDEINKLGLMKKVRIIFHEEKDEYFKMFNSSLHTTDILWTKPSEISFYTALGLPIVMAPPLGSQENFNEEWLTHIGSGIKQKNPKYADQWLFDWLGNGWLAEAAFQGFLDAEKLGTYNIENLIQNPDS